MFKIGKMLFLKLYYVNESKNNKLKAKCIQQS